MTAIVLAVNVLLTLLLIIGLAKVGRQFLVFALFSEGLGGGGAETIRRDSFSHVAPTPG